MTTIDGAQVIDMDAVTYRGRLLVHVVSEHVENASVHSGDAMLVLPPFSVALNKSLYIPESHYVF